MFEKFLTKFKVDSGTAVSRVGHAISHPDVGCIHLLREAGHLSFENGIYRLINEDKVGEWMQKLSSSFPMYQDKITPFAYDWLNRVYCVQADLEFGASHCLLVSQITDEVLKIPFSLETFHNEVLLTNLKEILEPDLFSEFLQNSQRSSLGITECASFDTPLFLGGDYSAQNMRVADINVDWEITAQLLAQTRNLKDGATISSVVQSN